MGLPYGFLAEVTFFRIFVQSFSNDEIDGGSHFSLVGMIPPPFLENIGVDVSRPNG